MNVQDCSSGTCRTVLRTVECGTSPNITSGGTPAVSEVINERAVLPPEPYQVEVMPAPVQVQETAPGYAEQTQSYEPQWGGGGSATQSATQMEFPYHPAGEGGGMF